MTFAKKVNISIGIIMIIVCLITPFFIIDINRRFPNAKIIENASVMWRDCEITPLDAHIYSVKSFNNKYPDLPYYLYLEGRDNQDSYYIITATVSVTNNSEERKMFSLSSNSYVEVKPIYLSNGGPVIDGDTVIEAGETKNQTIAVLCSETIADYSRCDSFEDNTIEIVFSYYPERLSVKFNSVTVEN